MLFKCAVLAAERNISSIIIHRHEQVMPPGLLQAHGAGSCSQQRILLRCLRTRPASGCHVYGVADLKRYLLVLDRCTGVLLDSSVTMVCSRHSYLPMSSQHGSECISGCSCGLWQAEEVRATMHGSTDAAISVGVRRSRKGGGAHATTKSAAARASRPSKGPELRERRGLCPFFTSTFVQQCFASARCRATVLSLR